MATPITDNPLVHDLYQLQGPVLTVYLNAPLPGPGIDDTDLRSRAMFDELRRSGAPSDASCISGPGAAAAYCLPPRAGHKQRVTKRAPFRCACGAKA